jgi:hypothetical protein
MQVIVKHTPDPQRMVQVEPEEWLHGFSRAEEQITYMAPDASMPQDPCPGAWTTGRVQPTNMKGSFMIAHFAQDTPDKKPAPATALPAAPDHGELEVAT